jgi:hypothetical protein
MMPEHEQATDINEVFSMPRDQYGEKYDEHLLQQYLLYVQTADKVTERRSLANTFFLTANTAILSALGIVTAIFPPQLIANGILVFLASITPVVLCYSWFRIIKSYQQLNTGKFDIIHEIETRLPLAVYKAEWRALGKGNDPHRYKPLTDVEKWVPIAFMLMYAIVAVVALLRTF